MKNNDIDYTLLGGLIYYYRNNLRLTRDAFARKLSDISNTKVTSKTIQRIENGEYSKLNNIYEIVAKGLNFGFADENDEIYAIVSSLNDKMYKSLNDTKHINNSYTILNEVHKLYTQYNNFLYLSEILKLDTFALEYYLYGKLDNISAIDIFKNIYPLFHDKTLSLLCNYSLFVSAKYQMIGLSYKDYNTYAKNLINEKIFLFEEIHYYAEIEQNYNLLNIYKNKLSKTNDPVEKFAYLSNMAYIELNYYGLDDAIKHLEESLEINDIKDLIPEKIYYQTYVRLGIINYKKKDYSKTFTYLHEIANLYPRVLNFNIILLCVSAEKTKQTDKIFPILKSQENINVIAKDIIDYFIAKYENKDPIILENMIISKLNSEYFDSKIYIDIFKNELFETVKKTKHYAKLLLINKKDD